MHQLKDENDLASCAPSSHRLYLEPCCAVELIPFTVWIDRLEVPIALIVCCGSRCREK